MTTTLVSVGEYLATRQECIDDYVQFGVPNIWLFDPRRRRAFRANGNTVQEATGVLEVKDTPVRIELALLWP